MRETRACTTTSAWAHSSVMGRSICAALAVAAHIIHAQVVMAPPSGFIARVGEGGKGLDKGLAGNRVSAMNQVQVPRPWSPPSDYVPVESAEEGVWLWAPGPDAKPEWGVQVNRCGRCGASAAFDANAGAPS